MSSPAAAGQAKVDIGGTAAIPHNRGFPRIAQIAGQLAFQTSVGQAARQRSVRPDGELRAETARETPL